MVAITANGFCLPSENGGGRFAHKDIFYGYPTAIFCGK